MACWRYQLAVRPAHKALQASPDPAARRKRYSHFSVRVKPFAQKLQGCDVRVWASEGPCLEGIKIHKNNMSSDTIPFCHRSGEPMCHSCVFVCRRPPARVSDMGSRTLATGSHGGSTGGRWGHNEKRRGCARDHRVDGRAMGGRCDLTSVVSKGRRWHKETSGLARPKQMEANVRYNL